MEKYGIVNPEGAALKTSILIDENFIVRHRGVNDHPLVRNLDEMQRIDDALNFIVIMERYAQRHGIRVRSGWRDHLKAWKSIY
ncbi:MAG: hypothetical protein MUR28_01595 [Candidatus Thioglobus sp.]|jgi:peroxiredoxin (alkyl hydroperoxide reductase subunit C)|nr:hypothetical protein [Candidatus Thioglobus sp.]